MKAKFLLPTLVGLTLAACTAEEDFSQSAEIKQSPITFTVDKDEAELDARATLSGSVVNFSTGDLISLYHGSTLATGNAGNVTAGQNAIFEGQGLDGALVFTTKSMVLEGAAVMVYPADTSFVNTVGGDITISVPAEQDAETKLFQPYMSEAFNIGAYNGKTGENDNTAGYGRNYTVPLKKVGSLLTMNLTAKNTDVINNIEGVEDIVIESVEINAGENNEIFASKVNVTTKNETPVLALDAEDENAATNSDDEKFAHMKFVSEVSTAESVNTIKTKDIDGNKAYFTLLPQTKAADDATATAITVYTSYGKVVVETKTLNTEDATTYPLVKSSETTHKNLAEAVSEIINNAWGENTSSANFKGEKTGASFARTLTFDVKNLDMNGTTVKSSEQLIDLIKVYKALGIKKEVIWTLYNEDGRDEFVMTGAALDKLIEVNTERNIKLELNNCAIVLSDKDATIEKLQNNNVVLGEIALQKTDGQYAFGELGADVKLGAGIEWTVDQTLTDKHMRSLENRGTLTLTNTKTKAEPLAVELSNVGEMKLGSNEVTLGYFDNYSTLNVGANQTLYFAGETSLLAGKVTNMGIVSANGGAVTNYAEIDNQFEVSVVYEGQTANGTFINIGKIENNGSSAVTYITQNGDDQYNGIITLTDRDDEVSINSANYPGYVKYTLKSTEANYVPEANDKFNWLIIDKTATVRLTDVSIYGVTETVDYLEIKGNPTNIECANFEVKDLFVEGSMRLLDGNKLTAEGIYVKNYILRAAGALSGNQRTEYTGKTYGDSATPVKYTGVIRTAASNN